MVGKAPHTIVVRIAVCVRAKVQEQQQSLTKGYQMQWEKMSCVLRNVRAAVPDQCG